MMRGVRAFAVLGCSALAGLSPLLAVARDTAGEVIAGGTALGLPAATLAVRAAAAGVLVLGALLIQGGWRRREAALGRRAAPPAESEIDAAWLERHVFSMRPELVGAAYDRRIGRPEVAAVLARLCGEAKLASRVAGGVRGWNNLELWLLVDREDVAGYERELIERLFPRGRTTSGDLLQQEYASVGFEPAAILRSALKADTETVLGIRPARRWPLGLGLAAVVAVGLGLTLGADAAEIVSVLIAAAVAVLGPLWGAFVFAPRYARDPGKSASRARACGACAGASVALLAGLILLLPSLPPLAPLGIAAWGLLGAALVAGAAASRESPEGVAVRRQLSAARRFFASELERPEPHIDDEWLPYLIALELTREVDRWYQAFGRIQTASRRQRGAQAVEPDRAAVALLWTGGAGALGGIGPSGPWIAATAGLHVESGARRPLGRQGEQRLELELA